MRIEPPPMLNMRFSPISAPPLKASKRMVFGCGRFASSRSNTTSAPGRAETMAFPVPWPSPVKASEPYSVTR